MCMRAPVVVPAHVGGKPVSRPSSSIGAAYSMAAALAAGLLGTPALSGAEGVSRPWSVMQDGNAAANLSTSPGDSTLISPASAEEGIPGTKSETKALLLSLLGTATAGACAPLVFEGQSGSDPAAYVLVGALVVGPSLGHFYSGRPGPALAGIGIRILAGAAVAFGGLASTSEQGATGASNAIAAIGAIVGGASVIYDIARAPHSARVHNDQVRQSGISFGITPSADGLSVTMTF